MDKATLLNLVASARARAEHGDLDITAQNEVISALERRGLDTTMAQGIVARIVAKQDANISEMERLLDELDKPERQRA